MFKELTVDKKNETIDVNELIEKIRLRIEKKIKSGKYDLSEIKNLEKTTLDIEPEYSWRYTKWLTKTIPELFYAQDILQPPELESHRKRSGKIIVWFKKLLWKITRPYIHLILKRQFEYNTMLTPIISDLIQLQQGVHILAENQSSKIDEIRESILLLRERIDNINGSLRSLQNRLDDLKTDIPSVKNQLTRFIEELSGRREILKIEDIDRMKEESEERDYVAFEMRHRGPEDLIKERQKVYLSYFKGKGAPIMDIGCGRGEFLELLEEIGEEAIGVELNREMVELCLKKGLDVHYSEGLSFLENLPDSSLGGILSAHLIEHLELPQIKKLIELAYKKLIPGGYLVIETPNPQCLSTFSGPFYLDITHIRPIHPEALSHLLDTYGFLEVHTKFLSPFPDEAKLEEIPYVDFEEWDRIVDKININIRKLNGLLYTYQDYAVIGRRG